MRRIILRSITALSLTAAAIAIGACATAPVDDFDGLTPEDAPADQQTSATLPPKTQNTDRPSTDAGSNTTPPKDASTPPKDVPPSTEDASTPPTPGGECDATDTAYYLKFIMSTNTTSCPCAPSECCYMGLGCVEK